MNLQEKNFWLGTVSERVPGTTGALPEKVDVAIVGAGFCGLSAALHLAKRGVRVAVLEAEAFGWGASCRNGGMVLTGLKLAVPQLISRYGRELVDGPRIELGRNAILQGSPAPQCPPPIN